jgi:ABC-type lipoprotein release transport system permease subunit
MEAWTTSLWFWPAVAAGGAAVLALAVLLLFSPVYKHIVCLKYLFGGWKAVVPLVSALPAALGVFLLVIVFAIMNGFAHDTREMTRGTLADVIVDAHMEGMPYYDDFIRRIQQIDGVAAATPIIQTYAVVRIKPHREALPMIEALVKPVVRPCMVIGIRPAEKAKMGRFAEFVERQKLSRPPGMAPQEWQRLVEDRAAHFLEVPKDLRKPGAPVRPGCIGGIGLVGTPKVEHVVRIVEAGAGRRILAGALAVVALGAALFLRQAARRHPGRRLWRILMGICLVLAAGSAAAAALLPMYREELEKKEVIDFRLIDYGDDVVVSTIPVRASGALEAEIGGVPKVSSAAFALVDTFKSGYWEADSSHLYVDFQVAQRMAGMDGGTSAEPDRPPARASQIQIKVRDPRAGGAIRDQVAEAWYPFAAAHPDMGLLMPSFNTWEDQQRMILTVVEVEKYITALMLGLMFLGFGVLVAVISYIMVYIKSRDIGILKALGARDAGVGSLFLGYGFVVGLIGVATGMIAALLMLHYLDAIELWVNQTWKINVFPREMYYFERIPRYLEANWCVAVGLGVLALSTLASMAGGLLAALKQPVETLRYE